MDSLVRDALGGGQHAVPRTLATPLGERLSQALDNLESAQRGKDDFAIDVCKHALSKLVNEARAARSAPGSANGGGEPAAPAPGFDGGVQRRPGPRPGIQPQSATSLLAQAMLRSREQRAEREAEPEHSIIANF